MVFLMVEMDSVPSKTSKTPKILKFINYDLDLPKSLPDYDRNFYNFLDNSSLSLDYGKIMSRDLNIL